jgi:hypothetical protein
VSGHYAGRSVSGELPSAFSDYAHLLPRASIFDSRHADNEAAFKVAKSSTSFDVDHVNEHTKV